MAASGAPTVTPAATATGYDEDTELLASTAGITEPNGIDNATLQWQWQAAAASDGDYAAIAGASAAAFTPLQAHVGQYIRVCAIFDDLHADADVAGAAGLCSAAAQVRNVNDAPQAMDGAVEVFTSADAATPFTFSSDDFGYSDEDGDELHSITLASVPDVGNFNVGGRTVVMGRPIMAAEIPTLSYYPLAGAAVQQDYASFTFTVSDGQASSDPANTLSIHLVPPGQLPATGAPTVAGTATQNEVLTAARGTVADPNGINEGSISWQWQQAASVGATFTDISGATEAAFTLTQAQVGQLVRVCIMFRDEHVDAATGTAMPGDETRCSAATAAIENVNDAPTAAPINYMATRAAGSDTVTIPASEFVAAFTDVDGAGDRLQSVTIVTVPDPAHGTLAFAGTAVTPGQMLAVTAAGAFDGGALTFAPVSGLQATGFTFRLSDGAAPSNTSAFNMTFGRDIEEKQVQQVSAILSVAAVANASNAIGGVLTGAVSSAAGGESQGPGFDVSLGGTSLTSLGRNMRRNVLASGRSAAAAAGDNSDLPAAMATADQRAWFLGTSDGWEYDAAYNAKDNSIESLRSRLQGMADGDLAMQYGAGGASDMRLWARYQRMQISGLQDSGNPLRYDGHSVGFYVGADMLVSETMRAGLALGYDYADLNVDADLDGRTDDVNREATSLYPYLRMDLGDGNEARVIAGFGSGDLEIESTANHDDAFSGISWQMLAGSLSHSRRVNDELDAKISGSLQYSTSDVDASRFARAGTSVAATSASSGELAVNGELSHDSSDMFKPFVSAAARKWFGDLSQSIAWDLGAGVDMHSGPVGLRLSGTRQLNTTDHIRHSLSLDLSLDPKVLGIGATFGNRWDSLRGRPEWTGALSWKRGATSLSLRASRSSWGLEGRLHW